MGVASRWASSNHVGGGGKGRNPGKSWPVQVLVFFRDLFSLFCLPFIGLI